MVGVAGVLAFSVSGRTREFGIRLAIGSEPRHLLTRVIAEGAMMAVWGMFAALACGLALQQLAGNYFDNVRAPGAWVVVGTAAVLLVAAMFASAVPAARPARVDVIQALRRSERHGLHLGTDICNLQGPMFSGLRAMMQNPS